MLSQLLLLWFFGTAPPDAPPPEEEPGDPEREPTPRERPPDPIDEDKKIPAKAAPRPGAPPVPGTEDMSETPLWVRPTHPPALRPVIGRPRVRSVKLRAARVDDRAIEIDGRPNERAWQAVSVLPEMVQMEPRYGFTPTHKTEVRVAYGDRGLYAAFTCYDDREHVRAGVFRKDQLGPSDFVILEIDPNNNDTNGYYFLLNPSGSQEDAQVFRDDMEEMLWDGVWKGAARVTSEGWTAEIFVPWSTIRFTAKDVHTFGLNVGRWLNHDGEFNALSPPPQGLPGRISWALDYEGVKGIQPGLNLELRPFLSFRGIPRRGDDSLDRSFPFLPNGGLDLKYGLRGNLTLDLAVNPDFGQAEVDPAVLNLGPFEVYFPERRTFFLESKEIFETRFQLFYSRRVGRIPRASFAVQTARATADGASETGELVALDPLTRIFGALRVTGQLAPGWSIGLLTANTGATFGTERFSDGLERRVTLDPISQYSVVRLRREFDSQTSVGAILTNVVRGGGESAFSGGFDYRIRFRERWRHSAQIIGTHDGQRTGLGAGADLSRTTKNTNINTSFDTLTPHANFNDIGFMRFNNFIDNKTNISVFNAQPVGRARKMWATLSSGLATSYTYPDKPTRKELHLDLGLTTLGLWGLTLWTGGHLPQYDLFETRGGIPYVVPFHWWLGGSAYSPDNKRAVAVFNWAYGEQNGRPGPDYGLELRLRPVNRLELTLRGDLNLSFGRPRWTTTNALGEPVFGRAYVVSYTGVLRGTLGILPNLTIQTFNQLYFLSARHTDFFILNGPGTLVPTDPGPYLGEVDQGLTSFISNSILRWEYLPGSFLFFVYTHRTVLSDFSPKFSYNPAGGFTNLVVPGVTNEDILFLKLQHLFGL